MTCKKLSHCLIVAKTKAFMSFCFTAIKCFSTKVTLTKQWKSLEIVSKCDTYNYCILMYSGTKTVAIMPNLYYFIIINAEHIKTYGSVLCG